MKLRDLLRTWWGMLHIGEGIRRRALWRVMRPLLDGGGVVLDAGCGRGDNAIALARQYANIRVEAIDMDPALVAGVERRIAALRITNCSARVERLESLDLLPYRFRRENGEIRDGIAESGLPAYLKGTTKSSEAIPAEYRRSQQESNMATGLCGAEGRYSIVYSVDVFEHLHDPEAALAHIARALTDGGSCILHVPQVNQRRWFQRFAHYHQDDHEREGFDPSALAEIITRSGLRVVERRHTFGPPGALAWELFHLASGVGKWLALLTYPIPWVLAWVDAWFTWKRGNGMLVVARKVFKTQ